MILLAHIKYMDIFNRIRINHFVTFQNNIKNYDTDTKYRCTEEWNKIERPKMNTHM